MFCALFVCPPPLLTQILVFCALSACPLPFLPQKPRVLCAFRLSGVTFATNPRLLCAFRSFEAAFDTESRVLCALPVTAAARRALRVLLPAAARRSRRAPSCEAAAPSLRSVTLVEKGRLQAGTRPVLPAGTVPSKKERRLTSRSLKVAVRLKEEPGRLERQKLLIEGNS